MIRVPTDTPPNIVMHNNFAPSGNEILPPAFEFLVKAALKYPTWRFALQSFRDTPKELESGVKAVMPCAAKVYNDKGIEVGIVELSSWNYRCEVVEFKNERIRRAIERGISKKTSKPDVALKLLSKWFTAPPLTEKMEIAQGTVTARASTASSSHRSNLRGNQTTVMNALLPFITSNIDRLWDKMQLPNNANLTLEQFKDSIANHQIAESVMSSACLTVLIEDDKYVVHEANSPIRVMTSSELPEDMRRSIGLLKLSDKGQFIRDRGFNAGDNLFLVVKSQDKQES
jgi:hypothetical protein